MIQIGDVVVSLDVFQEKFLCDLGACKGACCIEGDAGAPVELDEVMELEEVLPIIWDELASEARAVIEKQGVVYTDQEGDLVTSIVNNRTVCLLVMMRMVAAIARSKRPIERERLPSINRCPAIFILSGLEITDLIKR